MIIYINSFTDRLSAKNISCSKYCVVWLFYPGNDSLNENNRNDYIYGAIINKLILARSHRNLHTTIDYCIITPNEIPDYVAKIIGSYFDIHICYGLGVEMEFTNASEKHWTTDERNRWHGVMNKLYILHPDLFGCYQKVMYVDSDMMIRNAEKYLALLDEMAVPSGVYEYSNRLRLNKVKTHLVHDKFQNNEIIPKKYCTADTAYYHCVNASLLILSANEKDYERVCRDITSAEDMYKSMPQLRNHVMYFPEQEYLTNFYAGRWHSADSRFLSTADSPYHIAGKFWTFDFFDRRTGIPSEFWNFFLAC